MTLRQFLLLTILAALWGGSFLFMRLSSPSLGPFVVTAARLYFASIFMVLIIKTTTEIKLRSLPWKKLCFVGLFNSAIPFTLFAYGEVHLSASLGSILNGTTPIFTALLATLYFHEKYRLMQSIGFVLGITGVIIIVGWHPVPLNFGNVSAIIACIVASFCYGIGGLFAATKIRGYPPLALAFGQLSTAAIMLTPFMLYTLPHQIPSTKIIISLFNLGIFCTGFAFLIYYYLIREMGASKTLTVSYIAPIFGMLWGFLFLGEQIHLTYVIGLVTILSGIFLISRRT